MALGLSRFVAKQRLSDTCFCRLCDVHFKKGFDTLSFQKNLLCFHDNS